MSDNANAILKAIDLEIKGTGSGGGDGEEGDEDGNGAVVTIDPSVYEDDDPEVTCRPPCTFVLPPWTLPYTTTIRPPPVTSTVLLRWPSISTISTGNGGSGGGTGVTSTVYISKTTGEYGMSTCSKSKYTEAFIRSDNHHYGASDHKPGACLERGVDRYRPAPHAYKQHSPFTWYVNLQAL